MNDSGISIPVMEFFLIDQCPDEWRSFDLYVVRDHEVTFYVGQSQLAFDRVWRHLLDGFKGRSVAGRFVLCNWPISLRFIIELLDSNSQHFAHVGNDLNAAERWLIEQSAPCLNAALNRHPTPLPARYAPPTAPLRCSRSLLKLKHEAQNMTLRTQRERWREQAQNDDSHATDQF